MYEKYFENLMFLSKGVYTGNDMYVHFDRSQGAEDQKKISSIVKLGHVPASSIKGWLRSGLEALLLEHGISVCHPMPRNTMTNPRNLELYKKNLTLGYHERGACEPHGKCIIRKMFGDLGLFGNLEANSIFFYPAANGGAVNKNLQKVFNCIGNGRLEVMRASPRDRQGDKVTPYMTLEHVVGINISAPFEVSLHVQDEA